MSTQRSLRNKQCSLVERVEEYLQRKGHYVVMFFVFIHRKNESLQETVKVLFHLLPAGKKYLLIGQVTGTLNRSINLLRFIRDLFYRLLRAVIPSQPRYKRTNEQSMQGNQRTRKSAKRIKDQ